MNSDLQSKFNNFATLQKGDIAKIKCEKTKELYVYQVSIYFNQFINPLVKKYYHKEIGNILVQENYELEEVSKEELNKRATRNKINIVYWLPENKNINISAITFTKGEVVTIQVDEKEVKATIIKYCSNKEITLQEVEGDKIFGPLTKGDLKKIEQ